LARLSTWIRALLGVSAYTADTSGLASLGDPAVERIREAMGGQLAPIPYTQARWLLKDLESAQYAADQGDMSIAARLWDASKRDGILAGVLSTRTGGIVRLPKKFRGDAEFVSQLQLGHESVRSVFDEMCPPAELALLADDGIGLGVGVAELVPVPGRSHPVLVRLPPENLYYRWAENRWYYRAVAGFLPITPGDGRWVLHIPGGRIAPWKAGLWRAVGRAFINKEHALLHDQNWQAKLANPARVAIAPQGSTEEQQRGFFQRVMAWGVNTVFSLTPGWDVKLLESNGRGHESFAATVERSEREFVVAVAGQEVTTSGGAGFSNADVHKSIRADLIQATADSLAYTINTQILPAWVIANWGEDSIEQSPCVEWDTTPPRDQNNTATALIGAANAIKMLGEALAPYGKTLDTAEFCNRFGIPIEGDLDGDGKPDVAAAPVRLLPAAADDRRAA
jgi:phage gp29-like protein